MRGALKFGIGVGTAAIVATMSAGVAAATTGGQQATGSVAAVSAVSKHITRAEARQIAKAKVPHSRVVEVESDDLHNRAVRKVTLATPHGRVVVDVDKRTGKATILRHGGGRGLVTAATRVTSQGGDVGDDRGAGSVADDHGRDARDHDGAREERGDRNDRGDHGDRHGGEQRGDQHGADDSAGR